MARVRYGHRKTRVGVVVSDKMDKTVVVAVQTLKRHRLYKKMMRRDRRYAAHDEENACQVGDTVLIVETRPVSRAKRWRVAEVLVAAAIPEAEKVVIEEETPEEIRELDEAAAAAAEAAAAARAEAEAEAKARAEEEAAAVPAEEAAGVAEEEQPPVEEPAPETAEAPAAEEPPTVEKVEAAPEKEERPAAEAEGEAEAEEEESPPPESEEKEEQAPES